MNPKNEKQDPAESSKNPAVNEPQQPSPEQEQTSAAKAKTAEPGGHPSTSKFTGPRTPEGKEVSKRNALRHGIFSEVTVLPGESRDEFDSLLKGFSKALTPEVDVEYVLVEKLAIISWRWRRLLQAESAEIQHSSKFVAWDQKMQQSSEAEIAKRTLVRHHKTFTDRPGLLPKIQNPEILEYCVKLLLELQERIKSQGFNEKPDSSILEIIYGGDLNLHGTLRNTYSLLRNTSLITEEERQSKGYLTREQCKDEMLSAIDAEIQLFQNYRQKRSEIEVERTKLEVLRRGVPEASRADVLMRYEVTLERAFERTLNQFERIRRLRWGLPAVPRVEVSGL